jgi:hypothetical protein
MSLFKMLQGVKGVQFASLTYRTKATDELARYTLLLGASVENAYKGDLEKVEGALPTLTDPLDIEAAREIIASLRQSLDKGIGNNDAYTLQGVYAPTGIDGVFINTNDNALHLRNVFVQSKVVLQDGKPRKAVNSKPLTIAKDKLKKMLALRSNKLRQFALDNITKAKVNGDTIVFE